MANVGIERTKLDNLAVVISDRTGKPLPMKVDDMIDAVGSLRSTTREKWERPSDWPDLSKMDVRGGNIVYMTSYADEVKGFCSFTFNCTGSYTVEIGSISGSTFTADSTQSFTSGSTCRLYYGEANGTYKVLRVTGVAISGFYFNRGYAITIGTFNGYENNQGIIDVVGNLPSCTINTDFSNMYNLVNMEIGNLTITGNRSNMFYNCYSLASLDVSGWDTSGVTGMQYMFAGCYSLISLDVSGWNTSKVTNMSSMFSSCYSLASLNVSGWDTSSVTTMGSMFSGCHFLVSLDVSGWNTSKVTNMNNMFSNCYSLTSLDVSGWDISKVASMSSMFNSCCSLASLDVSGWDTSSITTMYNMFYNCYSLISLNVSGWDISSVTNIQNMFYYCTSLISLDVSRWDTSAVTNMSSTFYGCSSLVLLDVSGWNTSAVTNMSNMFNSCNSLTLLDVSGWDTSSVTTISSMFSNCSSITSLNVSRWDTSKVTNMNNTFYNCYSLSSLDISGWNFSSITTSSNMNSTFNNCSGLHGSMTIPSTVTQIGSSCFAGMRSLYEWHFKSTTPPTLSSTNAFSNMTDYGGKKIYVPAASLSAYQTATNWSTYASYMVGE